MAENGPGAGDGGDDGTDDTTGGPTDPPDTDLPGDWVLETMTSPTTKDLTAVWGSAADDVYAVGEDGTILHYDGDEWSLVDHGVAGVGNLHAVAGAEADWLWACGADREMVFYDGTEWWSQNTVFEPPEEPGAYRGLCVVGKYEAYAVGEGETIVRLDDWGWGAGLDGLGEVDYHAVWCGVGDDVYIAGHDHSAYLSSALVRLSSPWDTEPMEHDPIDNMYGIAGDENGQVWAVGFQDSVGSKLYRLDGDEWTVAFTSQLELLSLWAHSYYGLWAVGNTAEDDSVAAIESWQGGEPAVEVVYPDTWRLRGIWGGDGPDGFRIFAVGKEGAIVQLSWQPS
jgi:hypothetical protein